MNKTPDLRISKVTLLSLSYRVKPAKPSSTEESHDSLQGSISIAFGAKGKRSFRLRTRSEVKIGRVSFRAIHSTSFVSDDPLSKDIFKEDKFQVMVMNMLMPFTSELFATLTGKSFIIPIIAPDELPPETETEKGKQS